MNIRSRTPKDDQAIAELNRLAFKRGNEASLVESIRQIDRYIRGLSSNRYCWRTSQLTAEGEERRRMK